MKRRRFLVGATLSALAGFAHARPASGAKTVAVLRFTAEGAQAGVDSRDAEHMLRGLSGTRDEDSRRFAAMLDPFGFRLHRNLEMLAFDFPVLGSWERTLPEAIARMVAANPDCIVVDGGVLLAHVSRATKTIPIVTALRDPVASGFAKSIARPGGNVTGIHAGAATLDLKSLDFLRRAMPGLSCAGWIGHRVQLELLAPFEAVARDARLETRTLLVNQREEDWRRRLSGQFRALREAGCTGAVLHFRLPSVVDEVAKQAIQHRIAIAIQHTGGDIKREGLLLQYAEADGEEVTLQRLAAIVARVLKGERPGDMPFEGPNRYQLTVNRRTARRIGVTVPPDVMVLADRVVD